MQCYTAVHDVFPRLLNQMHFDLANAYRNDWLINWQWQRKESRKQTMLHSTECNRKIVAPCTNSMEYIVSHWIFVFIPQRDGSSRETYRQHYSEFLFLYSPMLLRQAYRYSDHRLRASWVQNMHLWTWDTVVQSLCVYLERSMDQRQ